MRIAKVKIVGNFTFSILTVEHVQKEHSTLEIRGVEDKKQNGQTKDGGK